MASTIWRGRLAFGMVSIPVRLHKAARRERIRFRNVYRPAENVSEPSEPPEDDEDEVETPAASRAPIREFPRPVSMPAAPPDSVARVRNAPVAETSDLPIEKARMLKGYEIEKDRFVTFQPSEVAALRPKTSTELDIAEFVHLSEIDPIFFETSYYAAPDRGGEKPYALLFRALSDTGYAAVGSLAMHGREHATVIRPGLRGLILHTLFFDNEVRADEEYATDASIVNAKELELAKLFVNALAKPFDASKLKDTFEERLQQLIDERAASAVERYRQQGEAARTPPVVDIMEALRKSLEMAKRPPQRETAERSTGATSAKPRTRRAAGRQGSSRK